MDMKLELVMVPVTDVDRARDFYTSMGWRVDFDQRVSDDVRFVQITPPGSACSIALGQGISEMEPGSLKSVQLVVKNADAALDHLRGCGIEAEGVDEQQWGRFVYFADPDGNTYSLQELPSWSEGYAASQELA